MSLIQGTARKVSGLLGRESWLVKRLRPTYESLLEAGTRRRGIPWKINGETYRVDPRLRHRLGQNYDAPVAAFIRERIRPGALCVDVGANVGVYVLQFARWAGPRGRVVAFEPNPGALSALRRHVEMNDLGGRVELVAAAVGARSGSATMYASDFDGMSRLGAPNVLIADRVREITVPVVTLDEFCEERALAPDWLFIDIEGFEIAALEGARRLLQRRGSDLHIVVEMHPGVVWESAGTTREGAEALLEELSLRAVPLTGQSDPLGDHGLVYLERAEPQRKPDES
jgi:FkbM family methyltransferase